MVQNDTLADACALAIYGGEARAISKIKRCRQKSVDFRRQKPTAIKSRRDQARHLGVESPENIGTQKQTNGIVVIDFREPK
ncbi:uncharacterized protein GLRG_01851 [Colletotrichum graminicola M1.001]|uniref:Uncharacterized protein n=1 Tax=Colletotrichum graminicola (strain M1.001 / M2 / FGSC 10212) TaxID=645133 RepID=E3Q9H7_COLGM|nr:uncharacterized protein GLRG_01851 [Colletotrichum graminicola M1.001]EFQ27356.1 hypothetical protein GLRG_01851 [Colletotrichum graminicola M1.001]